MRPASAAARVFFAIISSSSPKTWRRSECPSRTWVHPASLSISAETSPVNAPSRAKCMFWPPTLTAVPLTASATAWSAVAGGKTITSGLPGRSPAAISRASAAPALAVLYIFQLPAMSFRLIYSASSLARWLGQGSPGVDPGFAPARSLRAGGSSVLQAGDAGQGVAGEELQGRAPAGGHVVDPIRQAHLVDGGDAVTAADDRRPVALRQRAGDGEGAFRERLHLEHAHGAVPEDDAGLPDLGREGLRGLWPDVEAHPSVGDLVRGQRAPLRVFLEGGSHHVVDGKADLARGADSSPFASSSLSSSTRLLPVGAPCARRKV